MKIKLMKPINTACVMILGSITLFSLSSANASGCGNHLEKMAEIDCLSDDKKCIEKIQKELPYIVEA